MDTSCVVVNGTIMLKGSKIVKNGVTHDDTIESESERGRRLRDDFEKNE